MKKLPLLSILQMGLLLTACDWLSSCVSNPPPPEDTGPLTTEEIANRCIRSHHQFAQGQSDGLYGIQCIDGKKLLITTDKEGILVSTTDAGHGLRLESRDSRGKIKEVEAIPGVINKFYKTGYSIQKNQGDDKEIPWLRNLLPKKEKFYGSRGQEYHIVFKILGNYLILFKSSKNIEHIPYTERTILSRSEEGNHIKSNDEYYMVPFIGYKIDYCIAQVERDTVTNRPTKRYLKICQDVRKADNPDYIQLQVNSSVPYDYIIDKKNIFPAKYFLEGRWFFSEGAVQTADPEAHYSPEEAYFVKLEKTPNTLVLKDVSGKILFDSNKDRKDFLSVQWKEYEGIKDGKNISDFFEREDTRSNVNTERPYIQIDFKLQTGEEITDLIVTENYFSFVKSRIENGRKVKTKTSLLRESFLDQEGFFERRLFKDDQEQRFGILLVSPPQTEKKEGALELDAEESIFRFIHFNTDKKETVIKWHFSNYTVTNNKDGRIGTQDDMEGDFYRAIGREAVELWNRAFEIVTEDYCKKLGQKKDCKTIKVELATEEEGDRDLGDLRYNILNLVKAKVLSGSNTGSLLGHAPSYARADTGQILGTTTNVFIHNISKEYEQYIGQYIRYEIFQKDDCDPKEEKNCESKKKKEIHAVSPYIQFRIEDQCDEVKDLISLKKEDRQEKGEKNFTRDTYLDDSHAIASCERKISKEAILFVILHEMGHSFGLGHNFKASTDQNNYYHTWEEIKKSFPIAKETSHLSKTSSVMDYIPLYAPPLTVPGKYDLAVLRYLYLNHVEAKNGGLISLNIPRDPIDQKPLSEDVLSQMKTYASCWDSIANAIYIAIGELTPDGPRVTGIAPIPFAVRKDAVDFLCLRRDYGSTPLEIVQNDIEEFKRSLYAGRYKYMTDEKLSVQTSIRLSYRRVLGFYKKWLYERDRYLKGQEEKIWALFNDNNDEDETQTIKETPYQTAIKEGLVCEDESFEKKDCSRTEYDLYYPIRDVVFDFLVDIHFLQTMKCKVQDGTGQIRWLDLEAVKNKLFAENRQRQSSKLSVLQEEELRQNQNNEEENKGNAEPFSHEAQSMDEEETQKNSFMYVEDCESNDVQKFFGSKNLTYIDQVGLENFNSYYLQGPKKDQKDLLSVSDLLNGINNQVNSFNKLLSTRLVGMVMVNPENVAAQTISLTGFIFEPDFLQKFLDQLEKGLLYGEGASEFDLSYKNMLVAERILIGLVLGAKLHPFGSAGQNIIDQNLKYFQLKKFRTGTGEGSFFREIVEPLEAEAASPSEVFSDIPFLLDAYIDYEFEVEKSKGEGREYSKSFQQYVIDRADTKDNTLGDSTFTVPVISDNLIAKRYSQYDANLAEIEKFKEKEKERQGEALTLLEQMEKEALQRHNKFLK